MGSLITGTAVETSDPRRRERTGEAFTPPGWTSRWKESEEERRNSGQEERVLQGEAPGRRGARGGAGGNLDRGTEKVNREGATGEVREGGRWKEKCEGA